MLSNYTATTVASTNSVINVTTGNVVPDGRIARHWAEQNINIAKYFNTKPDDLQTNPTYTDSATFVETFGLHSVEFGNWLNQEDRLQMMSAGADCLYQLAEMLKIKPAQIGMNRKLSVSFGARGVGGTASAHYESLPYGIINITKPHVTSGSFAHEFAHAIDNLASYYLTGVKSFVTDEVKSNSKTKHDLYNLMEKILTKLVGTKGNRTEWWEKLNEDSTEYYRRYWEIFARTFEALLYQKFGKPDNKMFYKNNYKGLVYPDNKQLQAVDNDVMTFVKRSINMLNGIEFEGTKPVQTPIPEPKVEPKKEPKLEPKEEPKVEPKEEKPIDPTRLELDLLKKHFIEIKNVLRDEKNGYLTVEQSKFINSFQEGLMLVDFKKKYSDEDLARVKALKNTIGKLIDAVVEARVILPDPIIKHYNKTNYKEPIPEPVVENNSNTDTKKAENIVYGDEAEILTPTQNLTCKYAVVDVEFLIQSNDPYTFEANDDYPADCQTRDYRMVKGEQNKVIEYAEKFKEKNVINDSPDATTGTPIITKDGVVLGGNGRTMVLKRVVNSHKDKYENYKTRLRDFSKLLFGIDPEDYSHIKNPIAVRILDNAPRTECSKYSNILNNSNSQEMDEHTQSIAIAKQLLSNEKAYKNIALAIAESEAETVAEMFKDRELNKQIADTLRHIGFINNVNADKFITQDYMFTSAGRDIFVDAMLSSILPDRQLLTEAKDFKNKLIATLPFWIQINSIKNEFNIVPQLQKALRLEAQRKHAKLTLVDMITQVSAFSEQADVITIELVKLLEYTMQKDFKSFSKYFSEKAIESEEESIFGDKLTPMDVIILWKDNNQVKGLSGLDDHIILKAEKNAVTRHAQFLFTGTPVITTIDFDQITVHRKSDKKVLVKLDLSIMKVDTNLSMFGVAELYEHREKAHALLSYIKGMKAKKEKASVASWHQDRLFEGDQMPLYKLDPDQESLFDKPNLSNKIHLESLSNFVNDEIVYEDDIIDEKLIDVNLTSAMSVPIKPLRITGKTQKLLQRLNSPFQMLVWGTQGSGKSSLLLTTLDDLSINGKCLLVLTEETVQDGRIGERARRMRINNLNRIDILETRKLSDLTDALDTNEYKFVAIDSKDVFDDEKYLLTTYEKYNKLGINFITISHSIKDGSVNTGDRKYAYLCNTEIFVDNQGVAKVLKHRDAPKGATIPVFSIVKQRY